MMVRQTFRSLTGLIGAAVVVVTGGCVVAGLETIGAFVVVVGVAVEVVAGRPAVATLVVVTVAAINLVVVGFSIGRYTSC
jgi:hypothetical protein